MNAPDISDSTREEREKFIKERFKCISDCENCGLCKVLKGKTTEVAYSDYIEGIRSFSDVSVDYR